ncbi:MAG TPA: GerMN domain-containing protein [Candidatus Peribacteraceae bacterium]|nr:GerMN domain-containing protein [Candidatus Peribacteraceae bacterium]
MRRLLLSLIVLIIALGIGWMFFSERGIAPPYPPSGSSSSVSEASSASSLSASAASQKSAGSASSSFSAMADCSNGTLISLVFYSKTDFENAMFEHPVTVKRCIPKTTKVADAALRALFAGPTADEQKRGALGSADLQALGPLYIGVTVQNGTAVVNFHKDALKILNSAAARQMMVKSPIAETLKQFPTVTSIDYAIDGVIFNEWDA